MAKIRYTLAAVVATTGLVLGACSSTEDTASEGSTTAAASEASTITVEDNYGTQEITLPVENVASTDNRTFEVLSQWGVDLVAAPQSLVPFTVEEYKTSEDIMDIGNHREPNLEMLTAAQPDLIVNGQRFGQYYEDIKELNPDAAIVEFEPRDGEPLDEELKRQVTELGKIFEKEDEAEQLVADFDAAIERAKAAYNPEQTVMAVNVSGGEIGYLAPSVGRTFGPIFDMIGLTPALEVGDATDNHQGDDISVEAIADSNPDWLLVLDRDGGTNTRTTDDYTPAQTVIEENPALANVSAVQDGRIEFAPQDTYTNESIITYTEILNQLADAFEAAGENQE